MSMALPGRRAALRSGVLGGFAVLVGCGGRQDGASPVAGQTPDGTVEMELVQAAYIGSATHGSGTLRFHGRSHRFSITGLGIGGIGASTVEARGEVYNLRRIEQFGGSYAQLRYGGAVGSVGGGELWLQNAAGVVIRLDTRRSGLMLSLGGDGMVISMR